MIRVREVVCAERTDTRLIRTLDLDVRILVVYRPWDQTPAVTLAALAEQLTEVERAEVAAALLNAKTPPNP